MELQMMIATAAVDAIVDLQFAVSDSPIPREEIAAKSGVDMSKLFTDTEEPDVSLSEAAAIATVIGASVDIVSYRNYSTLRDLKKERAEFERMMARQSDADIEYTRGKLSSK